MSDCHSQLLIDAYHDRELDRESMAKVERHLTECTACTAHLASLRDLSARINVAAGSRGINQKETSRLHQAVTNAEHSSESDSLPLFRTMGLLGALAASVLIVCGVWLLDTKYPELNSALPGNASVALAPEWERVATTGYADPSPGLSGDTFFSPRYAVDWMLDDLTVTERKPWAKPKSF